MSAEPRPAARIWQDGTRLELTLPADPMAIRSAVAEILSRFAIDAMAQSDRATAEIVIAEVLNNIVEHAYAGTCGQIMLRLEKGDRGIDCAIIDCGVAMPGGALPIGQMPDLDPADLPEGGFGWHLIRSLAENIDYQRFGSGNLLRFRLPLGQ